jgi:hypothetical protein
MRHGRLAQLTLGLFLVTSWSCALHGDASGVRVSQGYSEVDEEVCGRESAGHGQVTAIIQDEAGEPIPGVHVHLIQADAARDTAPSVAQAATDETGRVTLLGVGNRYYTVLASAVGFQPEARILLLKADCAGSIRIRLRVIRVEGLS